MGGDGIVSAPAEQRAAEFQRMLLDPEIRAVIPPWGGETAIDSIPLLDWDAISAAEPMWVIGFSDIATLIAPLTLRAGWATIHGNNLMETPNQTPAGLVDWLDIVAMPSGSTFTQSSPNRHRRDFVDFAEYPGLDHYDVDTPSRWRRLDQTGGDVTASGRLIGGCSETISHLAGTSYLDTTVLRELGDGLLIYVEAAEADAASTARALHGMRLNGVFDDAQTVLVGRTYAPDIDGLTQDEAVMDALGPLGVPVLAGGDCGHWAPYMSFVNGAVATVEHTRDASRIHQTLR